MINHISIGLQRGYGLARSLYELKKNEPNIQLDYLFAKHKRIAKGFAENSLEENLCKYLLEAHEFGGICIHIDEIKRKLDEKKIKYTEKSLQNAIQNLSKSNVVFENHYLYFSKYYLTEKNFCEKISEYILAEKKVVSSLDFSEFPYFSEEQKTSVRNSLENHYSVITGGPGTGKTTILKSILWNLEKNGYPTNSIKVVTPTGKAAKRVMESAKEYFHPDRFSEPVTIHRLLSINPSTGSIYYNSSNPLPYKVLIIDEASMADLQILSDLMNAFPFENDKKIIFVGDPHQLLSVSSGAVFFDLVEAGINVSKLSISHRQSENGKDIKKLADAITKDSAQELVKYKKNKIEKMDGVQWIESDSVENLKNNLLTWKKLYSTENSQILCAFNNGDYGIEGINDLFVDENPKMEDLKIPLIATKNLNHISIFNGETCYLRSMKENEWEMEIGGEIRKISVQYKEFFQLAHAITIHKSQGSEYDHVCIVIPNEIQNSIKKNEILNKRLLYTAITRAKNSVTILGNFDVWKKAIENTGYPRFSGIRDRIEK